MDTPLEESNLAHIGSDEDKAAREAAAKFEVNWEGAGQKEGIQIWRVENKRDEHGNPDFGINPWPDKRYGEFYTGDSYIILQTTKDEEDGGLLWDIYFWIGSESSQDEYGVAAYKANELDDLLGDVPVQHRETEGYESADFMDMFPNLRYLDGGVDSGFRHVDAEDYVPAKIPSRLFHIRKKGKEVRSFQVAVSCKSLNQGDAFVLDAGESVYTWFGDECSPFEKQKTAELAHKFAESRHGHSHVIADVDDDNEDFWNLLGGKGAIAAASDFTDDDMPKVEATKMYILHEENSMLRIEQVEPEKKKLDTEAVCIVDIGKIIYVWIGKGSSTREKNQSMLMVQQYVKNWKREKTTRIVRVMEGQERRNKGFRSALP